MRLLWLVLLLGAWAPAQPDLQLVRPQDADGGTTPGAPHIVATLSGPVRSPLAVFLPGTDAVPTQYQILARTVAGWGMPLISLNYPNPLAVNVACAISLSLDCYEDVRREILTGANTSSLVSVGRPDSIEFRLLRLLQWLNGQQPARGWTQFYDGDRLLWHRIVISGHSQGGGHAGFIAKQVRTARAVMFAALDYNEVRRRIAPWMEAPGPTPAAAFFALGHERDELVRYSTLSGTGWPALGIDSFGGPLPVSSRDFGNVRTVSMTDTVGIGTAHSLVAADTVAFLNSTAQQQLERAWRHLYQGASATPVNAAGYQSSAVAPGSLVAVYAEGVRAGRSYDLRIAGRAATVFAVADHQVNAILPDLPPGLANVELRQGPQLWTGVLELRAAAPGVFTRDFSGQGEVAALWTGNILTIFGTGWRGGSGVRATLGGTPLEVQFSGAQPEFAGLDQMNLAVPRALSGRADLELVIEVSGVAANPVRATVPVF